MLRIHDIRRGVAITGFTTGEGVAEELAASVQQAYNLDHVEPFQFPYAMKHPEVIAMAAKKAILVGHSAAGVAIGRAITPQLIKEEKAPVAMLLANTPTKQPILRKLIPGALIKNAHDLTQHRHDPPEVKKRYRHIVFDNVKQATLHAPENFRHLGEISGFSTIDYLQTVQGIGHLGLNIAMRDEFFDSYLPDDVAPEWLQVIRTQVGHDGFTADPVPVLSEFGEYMLAT